MLPQSSNVLAPTIPESVYFIFQMTFAIITVRARPPAAPWRSRRPLLLAPRLPHPHVPPCSAIASSAPLCIASLPPSVPKRCQSCRGAGKNENKMNES